MTSSSKLLLGLYNQTSVFDRCRCNCWPPAIHRLSPDVQYIVVGNGFNAQSSNFTAETRLYVTASCWT